MFNDLFPIAYFGLVVNDFALMSYLSFKEDCEKYKSNIVLKANINVNHDIDPNTLYVYEVYIRTVKQI